VLIKNELSAICTENSAGKSLSTSSGGLLRPYANKLRIDRLWIEYAPEGGNNQQSSEEPFAERFQRDGGELGLGEG
jgi:hypothetical protein